LPLKSVVVSHKKNNTGFIIGEVMIAFAFATAGAIGLVTSDVRMNCSSVIDG
jgi:hypothetical protein